jgi:hypothetical protein
MEERDWNSIDKPIKNLMTVLCIEAVDEKKFWSFIKGDYCPVRDKFYSESLSCYVYTVQDDDADLYNFSETEFYRYFIDIKRERMLKLEKINERR